MRSWKLLVILGLLTTLACGGGGSGDPVGGGGGGSSALAASFSPLNPSPGPGTVALAGTAGTGANAALMTFDVNVTGVNDVFGLSFDLVYEAAAAQFVNSTAGSLLQAGGTNVITQINSSQPGRLVIGVSRAGGAGINASGTASVIRLTFRVIKAGISDVGFQTAALYNSTSTTPVPGIQFSGGTLSAN